MSRRYFYGSCVSERITETVVDGDRSTTLSYNIYSVNCINMARNEIVRLFHRFVTSRVLVILPAILALLLLAAATGCDGTEAAPPEPGEWTASTGSSKFAFTFTVNADGTEGQRWPGRGVPYGWKDEIAQV